MKIFNLEQILENLNIIRDLEELICCQKSAFINFSSGLYNVPSPMQFIFPEFGSDCHIKGGYKQGSKNLVLKIANGSHEGMNGLIIVFAADTGETKVILHDKGYLTTLRTALVGLIAIELLPWKVENIGIIGSGNLAEQLHDLIKIKYPKRNLMLYARNKVKAMSITNSICDSVDDLLENCEVIFTATSSMNPIIHDISKRSNKAIISLGSDDEHKSEISPNIFTKADLVIVDSKVQARKYGDIAKALKSRIIAENEIIELGELFKKGISENAKTIIADLSGLGVQDVAMVEFILPRLL